jgi:hypothetical protein
MMLETERLILRNWQESDVEHYLVLASDVGYHFFTRPGRFMVQNAKKQEPKFGKECFSSTAANWGNSPSFLKRWTLRAAGRMPALQNGSPEV